MRLFDLLYQVIWSLFYSTSSSSEHGTLYQLRNLINRRNVVATPMKDFIACDDFFITVLTGHIIAAAMKVLHINSPSEYLKVLSKTYGWRKAVCD